MKAAAVQGAVEMMKTVRIGIDWNRKDGDGSAEYQGGRLLYIDHPITLPENHAVYLIGWDITIGAGVNRVFVMRRKPDAGKDGICRELNTPIEAYTKRFLGPTGFDDKNPTHLKSDLVAPDLFFRRVNAGGGDESVRLSVFIEASPAVKGQVAKGYVDVGIAYIEPPEPPKPYTPPKPPKSIVDRVAELEATVKELSARLDAVEGVSVCDDLCPEVDGV